MPWAANGRISQDPMPEIPGAIEITQEQYSQALNGMLTGKVVLVLNGALYVGPPIAPDPQPDPEPVLTYAQELAALTAEFQLDTDAFNRSFSLAYLADGPTQVTKQATIRSRYEARKAKYSADLANLKIKHGV